MPHAFRTLKRCKSVDFAFSGYFAILRHWTPVSSSLCINSWYQINSISGQRISKPLTNLPAIWELGESPNLALAIWSSGSSKAKRRWSGPPTIYQHLRWTVSVTLEKNVLPKPLVSATRFRFPVLQRSLKTKHWKKCPEKAHLPKHDFGVTSFNECFISDTSQSPQSPIPSELKSRAATATSWEITDVQCNHMQSYAINAEVGTNHHKAVSSMRPHNSKVTLEWRAMMREVKDSKRKKLAGEIMEK